MGLPQSPEVDEVQRRMASDDEDAAIAGEERAEVPTRGAPLVATPARWAAVTALGLAAIVFALDVYLEVGPRGRTLGSFAPAIAIAAAAFAAAVWVMLRAEELRLGRELRTARAGTAALRGLVTRRRTGGALLGRLLSTRLGQAAVLLADGDRAEALDCASRGSFVMRGGRLERVRRVVEADLDRATGVQSVVERAVETLRGMPPTGNREADRYRVHVLVKAILELGDASAGLALAEQLDSSVDEEERVYRCWLRTWFEEALDPGAPAPPAVAEGELRRAALLARAHGADQLVELLDARVATIARQAEQK